MAVKVVVNTAPDAYVPQIVAAVMAALGRRPEGEEWVVAILAHLVRGCIVSIDRPDGGTSRWQFEECGEDSIKDTIREDLRREGYSWP